jgi:endonuclease-3
MKPRAEPAASLRTVVASLARLYPQAEPLSDPLAILVWENIGYLIDDARRTELFAEFTKKIGLTAPRIANAPMPVLADIARRGGMHPQKRAERLVEIGRLAIAECDGDIAGRLRALPLAKARVLLKKFPSVGDPGADRILLFAGIAPRACVESNGLRALVRLGFAAEGKSYAEAYRNAVAALAEAGSTDSEWLRRAWLVLREHGKALCKRSAPVCEPCPLDPVCGHRAISGRL